MTRLRELDGEAREAQFKLLDEANGLLDDVRKLARVGPPPPGQRRSVPDGPGRVRAALANAEDHALTAGAYAAAGSIHEAAAELAVALAWAEVAALSGLTWEQGVDAARRTGSPSPLKAALENARGAVRKLHPILAWCPKRPPPEPDQPRLLVHRGRDQRQQGEGPEASRAREAARKLAHQVRVVPIQPGRLVSEQGEHLDGPDMAHVDHEDQDSDGGVA